MPLLEGEDPPPLQRVEVAAAFGNGVGSVHSQDFVFMNADLTVYRYRPLQGRWVGLCSCSDIDDTGFGLV